MMIYTIHDNAAGFFMPPFTAQNDSVATRLFIGSMGDSFTHRTDFNLYRIGSFDSEDGSIDLEQLALVLRGDNVSETLDPRPRPEVRSAVQ